MKASEVAKWHGKPCIVTLKQGSVLVCDEFYAHIGGYNGKWTHCIMKGIGVYPYPREIRSIKARRK